MKKAIIKGMCCYGCAKDVKHILESIYGVSEVEVICNEGYAFFQGFVSKDVVADALESEGYQLIDIENIK
jgi:copper chaperone CopZ